MLDAVSCTAQASTNDESSIIVSLPHLKESRPHSSIFGSSTTPSGDHTLADIPSPKTFSDLLQMFYTSPTTMCELSQPLLNPLSPINTPARGSEGGEIALSLHPSPRAELELEAVSSDRHSPKDNTSRQEVPSRKDVAREVSPKHVRSVHCPRKEELKSSVRTSRPPLRPSQVSNVREDHRGGSSRRRLDNRDHHRDHRSRSPRRRQDGLSLQEIRWLNQMPRNWRR